jgi:hypothetical protein
MPNTLPALLELKLMNRNFDKKRPPGVYLAVSTRNCLGKRKLSFR